MLHVEWHCICILHGLADISGPSGKQLFLNHMIQLYLLYMCLVIHRLTNQSPANKSAVCEQIHHFLQKQMRKKIYILSDLL